MLDFAELEEFVDLKLKNYSSGMLVRLAFSVMIQAEADILLIDEVLAVGDAAFQQKCRDVFRQMRSGDRTVVLVTHDMTAVQSYCHRAMLLDEGEISLHRRSRGDGPPVPADELRQAHGSRSAATGRLRSCPTSSPASRTAWLEDAGGETDRERRGGRADPADRRDRGPPRPRATRPSRCSSTTPTASRSSSLNRELEDTGGTGVMPRARSARDDQRDDREPAAARALRDRLLGRGARATTRRRPSRPSSSSTSSSSASTTASGIVSVSRRGRRSSVDDRRRHRR